MSTGLISLAAGVLIGLMYAALKVRSPAPPALALIGLLGMRTADPGGTSHTESRTADSGLVSSRVCAENQRHGASRAREGKPRRLMIF